MSAKAPDAPDSLPPTPRAAAPDVTPTSSSSEETRRLEQQLDELTALLEITRRLHEPFELHPLLEEILGIVLELIDAEGASLLLVDAEQQQLDFAIVRGGAEEQLRALPPLSFDQGVAGWVVRSGETARINDVEGDPRFDANVDSQTRFHTRSILATPLRDRGELLGVLEVINKRGVSGFTADHQRTFELMAAQAAAAIGHVRREETRREAERLATVGGMASAIIHDLKNPLTAIKGFAELLRDRSSDNRRYAEIIVREIDRLVQMTQEVLDYARGGDQLKRVPTRARAVIDELIEFLRPDFEGAGIAIELAIEWDGTFLADPDKLRRALFNLAGNARDAMQPGGGVFRVGLDRDGGSARLRLSDSGAGMDAETLKRCFEPFFTRGKNRGTGLGLAIVRTIVEAHDGTLRVHSAPGEGTTFELRFPLEPTPEAAG